MTREERAVEALLAAERRFASEGVSLLQARTEALLAFADAEAMRERAEGREAGLRHAVSEAKRILRLVQGCLECNADDERRWAETIAWLERLS